ncbi:hypothetical protein BDP27DRAFT_1421239 [Rhodocollybia butyracea]|uniref:Uncharacterized protein n=1 Tax=Rhodocollybia butyracea TaxID=206335 RepID=A0A9P5U8T4_9AGAR|nr:hypothetical protein BDP27DRAFT_1421239 [Rhodocollybia butyracea]
MRGAHAGDKSNSGPADINPVHHGFRVTPSATSSTAFHFHPSSTPILLDGWPTGEQSSFSLPSARSSPRFHSQQGSSPVVVDDRRTAIRIGGAQFLSTPHIESDISCSKRGNLIFAFIAASSRSNTLSPGSSTSNPLVLRIGSNVRSTSPPNSPVYSSMSPSSQPASPHCAATASTSTRTSTAFSEPL